jgi:hypothetical protein
VPWRFYLETFVMAEIPLSIIRFWKWITDSVLWSISIVHENMEQVSSLFAVSVTNTRNNIRRSASQIRPRIRKQLAHLIVWSFWCTRCQQRINTSNSDSSDALVRVLVFAMPAKRTTGPPPFANQRIPFPIQVGRRRRWKYVQLKIFLHLIAPNLSPNYSHNFFSVTTWSL